MGTRGVLYPPTPQQNSLCPDLRAPRRRDRGRGCPATDRNSPRGRALLLRDRFWGCRRGSPGAGGGKSTKRGASPALLEHRQRRTERGRTGVAAEAPARESGGGGSRPWVPAPSRPVPSPPHSRRRLQAAQPPSPPQAPLPGLVPSAPRPASPPSPRAPASRRAPGRAAAAARSSRPRARGRSAPRRSAADTVEPPRAAATRGRQRAKRRDYRRPIDGAEMDAGGGASPKSGPAQVYPDVSPPTTPPSPRRRHVGWAQVRWCRRGWGGVAWRPGKPRARELRGGGEKRGGFV